MEVPCAMIRRASRGRSLSARSGAWTANALELVQADENVAWFGAVWRAEHAREVQLVDDPGRATITNFEPTLQQRRRALLVLNDHLGRLAEELVAIDGFYLVVIALSCLERLALPDCLENIRLVQR